MNPRDACGICVEPYHRVRKPVQCPRCDAVACTSCTKTFLLGNTIEAKCMSCQSAWDMEFLRAQLSKSFLDGDYRKHQMAALLSEGMASVGELQRLVPLRNAMDEADKTIGELEADVKERRVEIKRLHVEKYQAGLLVRQQTSAVARNLVRMRRFVPVVEQLSLKEQAKDAVFWTLYEIRRERAVLEYRWRHNGVGAADDNHEQAAAKNVFFLACPGNECRGRLSTAYKCGLCEHWFCPDCHGDKGLERSSATHICHEDNKKTVALLKDNTKPCPKCHEGIFKVSGCDQMWCTRCHTCFSWQSGKILNGVVHNPHFYAWQREMHGGEAPRVPGDDPCGGPLPPFHVVMGIIQYAHSNHQRYLERSHRLATHLLDTVVFNLRRSIDEDAEEYRRKWGVEYLRARISKEEWAKKLYFVARRRERKQRILFLMEMVVGTTGDTFRAWPSADQPRYHPMTYGSQVYQSLQALFVYANEQIDVQNRQYGTKLRHLDPMSDDHYTVA